MRKYSRLKKSFGYDEFYNESFDSDEDFSSPTMVLDAPSQPSIMDLVNVGDILCDTWGYEQTNVSFFKVIGKTGKSVRIVEIGMTYGEGGYGYSYTALPDPSKEIGSPFMKRVLPTYNGLGYKVRIESFLQPELWNGQPVSGTSYA